MVAELEGTTQTIRVGIDDPDEDYMAVFDRDEFLDAIVALYPENVAYQFKEEKE